MNRKREDLGASIVFVLQPVQPGGVVRGGAGQKQEEKGEKQFTNMVDSSYVSLFLYQNIFKRLQKKKKKEQGKN